MTFKIAYCAGHYLQTPGKRLPRALDQNETCEWILNNRVARYFAQAAQQYPDVQLLRTDDPTGEHFIDIPERCAKANVWGADLYLDIHHNAAGRVFSGGGVEAFSYPKSAEGKKYRDAIYAAVIAAGGLKGNRSQPMQEKAFDSLRLTKSVAVLIEYGYMDSKIDAPIILTDAYAKKVAYATMEGIAKAAGLKKKAEVAPIISTATVEVKVLKKGTTGADVKAMQLLLIGYGYGMGTYGADGDFGSTTEQKLKEYQKATGIPATGICDSKTWHKLLGVG